LTKSRNQVGMTQRTYPMSDRSKTILDQINILTSGYTKADLVNLSIFWMATTIKKIQDNSPEKMDIKDAIKEMRVEMSAQGYNAVRDNIMNSMVVTQLDRFFISVDQEDEGN